MLLSDALLKSIEEYKWQNVALKRADKNDYNLWLYVAKVFFGEYNPDKDFSKIKDYYGTTIKLVTDRLLVINENSVDKDVLIKHSLVEARLAKILYLTLKPVEKSVFTFYQQSVDYVHPKTLEEIAREKASDLISETNSLDYSDRSILQDIPYEDIGRMFIEKTGGHTFSSYLFELIEGYGYDEITVYKNAGFNRQQFSKIRRRDYQPTRITAFALIIAMRLDLDESLGLLKYAGLTFSPAFKLDRIIEFFIREGIYDMDIINFILYRHDLPLLGSKCRN